MKKTLLIVSMLSMAFVNVSWAFCTDRDVKAADDRWKAAIDSNDAERVAHLYAKDGILIPTFGFRVLTDKHEREEYFETLFEEIDGLSVHYDKDVSYIQFVEGGAVSSGHYQFRGRPEHDPDHLLKVDARYTFVYKNIKKDTHGCKLQLINHHSSENPIGHKDVANAIAANLMSKGLYY